MPLPARPARVRRRALPGVLLLAVLAAGCQVRVGTDVTVGADGSGRLALTVALDEELATSLGADEIDPFAGLDALPDDWTVERSDPDGGRAVTVTTEFEEPADLTRRVDQLRDGLDQQDPLLLEDVRLDVADDGGASLTGRAGFRPPASTGLAGGGVAFDGEDLAAMLAERGDEVLRVDLRVTLPGAVRDSNADEVDGRTATWHLPATELVEVRAEGDAPASRTWWVVAVAALAGLAVGWVVVGRLRRR